MSGRTSRFGFSKFGGTVTGTIIDDGQKYTSIDRDTLDRLLAAIELHDHHLGAVTSAPATGPDLTLVPSGGALRGGYTYYYRFSVVDADGNESIASPEVSQVTPALLAKPGLPQLNQPDPVPVGTLGAGIYYYALTAIRGAEESVLGPAIVVSLAAGTTSVQLLLPDYGLAESFQVWRMASTDRGYTRVEVINDPETDFIDDGTVPADPCAVDPSNAPPTYNTGVSSNAIDVDLPVGTVLGATDIGWRIYRSTRSGVYPTASLVALVTELNDEMDPDSGIVRSYTDIGNPLQNGLPMSFDQNMRFQPLVLDNASALPLTAGYPDYYPLVVGGILYVKLADTWVALGADAAGGGATILTDVSGARWLLDVDIDGALITVATVFPGPPTAPQNVTVN
jgi:hypothetical protein